MSADMAADAEEYRLADRFVVARSWALAAALADRLPGMRVSQVVDETRPPLLLVHDAGENARVTLDLVTGVLFGAASERLEHLYWDEVVASSLADVVEQIAALTGPVVDDGSAPRRAAYRTIARTLAEGLADDPGWWAQCVRLGGVRLPETVALLAQFPAGEQVAAAALAGRCGDEALRFHEPLWVVRHGMEIVELVDTGTGRVHARDGSWRPADDGPRPVDDGPWPVAASFDATGAIAFREMFPSQWSCLDAVVPVDPTVDLAPIRYGHVRAEAWRLVADLVAAGAAVRVVGPQEPAEICRLVDADGRTRVCLTADGLFVDDPDVVALDWWDVFAAPFPSSVPDQLLAGLPVRDDAPDTGAADLYRRLARLLATVADDEAEWRVLRVAPRRWVVARMLEVVVVLDEADGEVVVGRRWERKARAGVDVDVA